MKDIHFIYSNNKSQAGILYVKDKNITYWDKVATGELTDKSSLHNYLDKLNSNGYELQDIVVNRRLK